MDSADGQILHTVQQEGGKNNDTLPNVQPVTS